MHILLCSNVNTLGHVCSEWVSWRELVLSIFNRFASTGTALWISSSDSPSNLGSLVPDIMKNINIVSRLGTPHVFPFTWLRNKRGRSVKSQLIFTKSKFAMNEVQCIWEESVQEESSCSTCRTLKLHWTHNVWRWEWVASGEHCCFHRVTCISTCVWCDHMHSNLFFCAVYINTRILPALKIACLPTRSLYIKSTHE